MQIDPQTNLNEIPFVIFDTETTGKYPVGNEICEIAAIKWVGGKTVDQFESFLKPRRPMDINVIQIHGISNETVATAPHPYLVLPNFMRFISNCVVVAHHSPFDLGFLCAGLSEVGLAVPQAPALCTSLLSRRLVPESVNHRLKTLAEFFQIQVKPEHRAMVDTLACLEVFKRCIDRLSEPTWENLWRAQGADINWDRFSLEPYLSNLDWRGVLMSAFNGSTPAEMVYTAGSRPGASRVIDVVGLVRSLDGDFLVGADGEQTKRYFTDNISSIRKRPEL